MYKRENFDDAIRHVAGGNILVSPLISRHFAFADYLRAYEYTRASGDRALKILIDINRPLA